MTTASLYGACLHVDLSALVQNWQRYAAMGNSGACVKADAYGLGAVPVSNALWNAGCRSFFVAYPEEGLKLRQALPPEAEIFILMGLLPGTAADYHKARLTPLLVQPEEFAEWQAHCRKIGERLACGIHIDTGIHRLGFSEDQLRALNPDDFAAVHLSLIISHLANADNPNDEMNARQLARFEVLRQLLPPCRASLSNSPGGLLGPAYGQDLIRPGIGLYGASPQGLIEHDFEIVARLTAPVLQVSQVAAGERIGYSGTYQTKRASRIAILGVGYADGYPRALSSKPEGPHAQVMFAEGAAPVVGRVSMDMITVDVTDLPKVVRGSVAELMGETIRLETLAQQSGTIAYEILTRLGSRFGRIYSGGDSISPRGPQ